jgi:HAD superfamily hydrolase (TIGR01509 family)
MAGYPHIRGVVFDMDGTVFDTEQLAIDAWLYAAKIVDCPMKEEHLRHVIGINKVDSRIYMEKTLGPSFQIEKIVPHMRAYTTDFIARNGIPLKPGLMELLDFLTSSGYAISMATSSDQEKVLRNLELTNTLKYFPLRVCGDMVSRGKPDPEIYLKSCELMQLEPSVCLALEDSPAGIQSALAAGLTAVFIPDLIAPEENQPGTYEVVNSLLDVIPLLKS